VQPLRPAVPTHTPLEAVAERAGAQFPDGAAGTEVSGVSLDSRAVLPGDLYAGLPGFNAHGAGFARGAVGSGAVAVLTDPAGMELLGCGTPGVDGLPVPVLVVDRPRAVLGTVAALVYGEPGRDLQMFGITGTNGKTTTAYLLEAALRGLGVQTGLIGTVETRIGPERVKSVRTTPEATDLHAILAVMRERGARSVVMEVSSHALDQHRVDGAVYDVALFTNLSHDHLDYHHSMSDYYAAKALLFTPGHARRGVVCVDDEWGQRLAREAGIPVVTLSSGPRPGSAGAGWSVREQSWPTFVVDGPGCRLVLRCHLAGTFNLVNTAMAAVALVEAGYAPGHVAAAMSEEPSVPGRMERVSRDGAGAGTRDPRCLVDFAHTPTAVAAALEALRSSTSGRLVVVLGAGGDRDRGKRAAMGASAARHADVVIVTDDNPRSEDPAAIREAVLAGARAEAARLGGDAPALRARAGRAAAIAEAVRVAAGPGDTVVILGKGHETGQEVSGVIHPFDDRDAVRAALGGRPYRPEEHA